MSAPAKLRLCLRKNLDCNRYTLRRYATIAPTRARGIAKSPPPDHRQKLPTSARNPAITPPTTPTTASGITNSLSPDPRPKFPTSALSYHWDTTPPTSHQLSHASKFFSKQPPTFLWSAEKFKTMDYGNSPEVCFLGRSNVGKSSLLNALLRKKIAHTSSKPGRTKLMNAFAVGGAEDNGKNRLVVLDMPGYGKGGRAEWGIQIMKYLEKREELKMAFLLIDAGHGLKQTDVHLIKLMKDAAVPFQIVLAKVDRVLFDGSRNPSPGILKARLVQLEETTKKVKKAVQPWNEDEGSATGEVIACSASKWVDDKLLGIDAVRFAMLRAAGLEFRPKITLAKTVDVVSYEELYRLGQISQTT